MAERTIVKKVDNAVWYSDGTLHLKMVRLSYPHVFHMNEMRDPKTGQVNKSYSVAALLPKETHDAAVKLCKQFIKKVLEENNRGENIPADRKFLRDGDPKDEDDVGKSENAGCFVVTARESKKRPITLSNKKDPATGKAKRLVPDVPEDEDMIYGGCWGDVLIRPWWQSHQAYGKRVNANLVAVQFRKHDEPFGTGRIKDTDIDETFESEEEDYMDNDSDDL
jgi:hypothetical protein